jgi:hypothetical protein
MSAREKSDLPEVYRGGLEEVVDPIMGSLLPGNREISIAVPPVVAGTASEPSCLLLDGKHPRPELVLRRSIPSPHVPYQRFACGLSTAGA